MIRLLFDLESDGFLEECTKVHCIAAVDVDSGAKYVWGPGDITQALTTLDRADVLIGHNIQRFDIPVLTKLHSFAPRGYPRIVDTMILARLIFPNVRDTDAALLVTGQLPKKGSDDLPLIGRHTLEAWGYRLGEHKATFSGPWETWSQAMQDYMVQDVATNFRLWKHLKVDSYSQSAVEIEHRIAYVCDQMEKAGVPFDVAAAGKLHAELVDKKAAAERQLVQQFGAWLAPVTPAELTTPFVPKKDNKGRGYVAGAPLTRLKRVEFNPGSREHIAKVLIERGWKPKERTPTGKPEINEAIVDGLVAKFPEAAGLADYLMLGKRISQLADGEQAWLKVVKPDGRIHGVINPMGTTTGRASHFNPNLSQVPAVKNPYGKECRSLFYAPEGWVLVGADQEGLELRGLSHYLKPKDKGSYESAVLAGDPHWTNVLAMGLLPAGTQRVKDNQLHTVCREAGAKRFIYAFLYGAGDGKCGEIILDCALAADKIGEPSLLERFFGGSRAPGEKAIKAAGKAVREAFLKKTGGLEWLKAHISREIARSESIPGLDQRRLPARSEHSALNFLIQSAGAILCKRWVVEAFSELESKYKHGWDGDFVFCLWVHDEVQVAARKGLENDIGEIIVKHAKKAGEPYGFRVPLDSKYVVGRNWGSTH